MKSRRPVNSDVRRLIFSMKFELDQLITTDAGLMRVRTLSHYLFFKKPRTTVFSAANPFKEDTLITFAWNTADSDNLGAFHQQIM
jgi:inorganic pyrophosphatase/exopolyphosphatase